MGRCEFMVAGIEGRRKLRLVGEGVGRRRCFINLQRRETMPKVTLGNLEFPRFEQFVA
jgi:hypothetical protein